LERRGMRKKEGTRERDEREKAFKREKMLQNRRVVSGEPRRVGGPNRRAPGQSLLIVVHYVVANGKSAVLVSTGA
jgi:hypothetical protein